MFRSLAQLLAAGGRPATDVFLVHPLQLSRWLDEAWAGAATVPTFGSATGQHPFLGDIDVVGELDLPKPVPGGQPPVPSGVTLTDPDVFTNQVFTIAAPGLIWDHLAYAYVIESTGVMEIMAEVVRRLVVGETLDTLSAKGLRWLRATEELFFRDPPLFSIGGIVSQARPHMGRSRLNAYWRLMGLEVPHARTARWAAGSDGDQPWKADTGTGVNTGFREKWSELLRQVWLGVENRRNGIGPNGTDREFVAFLCVALKDMQNMRRQGGKLAREEFVAVSILSWFHLTLESDTPIVVDLKAEATNPADRLAKIAQRVGMTPAARSRELFELADLMSALLRAIELGTFDTGAAAETLYLPFGNNDRQLEDMNRIIDLWQSATGDRVKDPVVSVAQRASAQPVRLPSPATAQPPAPAPALVGSAATNGRG